MWGKNTDNGNRNNEYSENNEKIKDLGKKIFRVLQLLAYFIVEHRHDVVVVLTLVLSVAFDMYWAKAMDDPLSVIVILTVLFFVPISFGILSLFSYGVKFVCWLFLKISGFYAEQERQWEYSRCYTGGYGYNGYNGYNNGYNSYGPYGDGGYYGGYSDGYYRGWHDRTEDYDFSGGGGQGYQQGYQYQHGNGQQYNNQQNRNNQYNQGNQQYNNGRQNQNQYNQGNQNNRYNQNNQNSQRNSSQGRSEDELKKALSYYGLKIPFSEKELKERRKELIKRAHPDSGGSEEEAKTINAYFDILKRYAS